MWFLCWVRSLGSDGDVQMISLIHLAAHTDQTGSSDFISRTMTGKRVSVAAVVATDRRSQVILRIWEKPLDVRRFQSRPFEAASDNATLKSTGTYGFTGRESTTCGGETGKTVPVKREFPG